MSFEARLAQMKTGGGLVLAALLLALAPAASAKLQKGKAAPPFTAQLLKGGTQSLDQLKGQVVIINFWATWCAPCRPEMAMLSRTATAHKGQGLAIIAVLFDDKIELARLDRTAAILGYPIATAISLPYLPVKNKLPSTIVIDRKGKLRYIGWGSLDERSLGKIINPLLAK